MHNNNPETCIIGTTVMQIASVICKVVENPLQFCCREILTNYYSVWVWGSMQGSATGSVWVTFMVVYLLMASHDQDGELLKMFSFTPQSFFFCLNLGFFGCIFNLSLLITVMYGLHQCLHQCLHQITTVMYDLHQCLHQITTVSQLLLHHTPN